MDNYQEATKTAQLAYKVGLLMDDPYEYGLVELRLANILGREKSTNGITLAHAGQKEPQRHAL